MSFLNQVRSLPLPPIKNVMNVAWQTARQNMPDKSRKNEYEQPHGEQARPSQHGVRGPPPVPPRPQGVRFADTEGEEISYILNLYFSYFGAKIKIIQRTILERISNL